MKAILEALILTFLLYSCQSEVKQIPVTYRSTFPLDTTIMVDRIPLKHTGVPHKIHRMGNRIVVAHDYGLKAIYGYPEIQFLREQVLDYNAINNDENQMYFSKNGIVDIYSITNADSLRKISSFSLKPSNLDYAVVSYLDKKRYIYADNYRHSGLHEFHFLDPATGKDIASKGLYPEGPNRFKSIKDFKLSYVHGVSVKPDRSLFAIFYSLNRRVRIYDFDGNLQHDVFLDYPPGNNKVINLKYMYQHILEVQTTDSYIYLLCPEQLLGVSLKPECYIVVMNWEGNLVARYHLQNCFAYSFFVDEQRGILLGGAYCVQGGGSFFKFDLQHLRS